MFLSINPSSPHFDEHKWVIDIRRIIEEEIEEEACGRVSIFSVPKALLSNAPLCYIPQQISIGPYHYKNPQLYEMQRHKIFAAKRVQSKLQPQERFEKVVQEMERSASFVRENYHTSLLLSNSTLSWMMAIDASFLLEFLHLLSSKEPLSSNCAFSNLIGFEGRKSTCTYILKDIVMMENQIPLLAIQKVAEIQFLGCSNDMLLMMFVRFCNEVSPFTAVGEVPQSTLSQSSHLLHFLYKTILSNIPQLEDEDVSSEQDKKENYNKIRVLKKIMIFLGSKLLKLVIRLPLAIASNIPIISLLKQPVEELLASCQDTNQHIKHSPSNCDSTFHKPPLMEEITIPSVTELTKAGVRFSPVKGSVSKVFFDAKTATLHLPIVCLDVNTEVVMRNLVAFEAAIALGPLVFTRYTELMNGIVDTENDAKLLRERGVILSHLKSDGEVANLWNGMSKSIRLTKVPFLDRAIEDVNKFYRKQWRIRALRFLIQRISFMVQLLFMFIMTIFVFLMTFYLKV